MRALPHCVAPYITFLCHVLHAWAVQWTTKKQQLEQQEAKLRLPEVTSRLQQQLDQRQAKLAQLTATLTDSKQANACMRARVDAAAADTKAQLQASTVGVGTARHAMMGEWHTQRPAGNACVCVARTDCAGSHCLMPAASGLQPQCHGCRMTLLLIVRAASSDWACVLHVCDTRVCAVTHRSGWQT